MSRQSILDKFGFTKSNGHKRFTTRLKTRYCPLCFTRLCCCFNFHGSEASIVFRRTVHNGQYWVFKVTRFCGEHTEKIQVYIAYYSFQKNKKCTKSESRPVYVLSMIFFLSLLNLSLNVLMK